MTCEMSSPRKLRK